MAASILGRIHWDLDYDERGHRDYHIHWLVKTDDPYLDGPATVAVTADLPLVGASWAYGNEVDPWAYCRPNWKITPLVTKEANDLWIVEQLFSSKP